MKSGKMASLEALDPDRISRAMSPGARQLLAGLTVLQEVDSTNSFLQRLPPCEQYAHAVLAESQSRGRGRRERSWHSPPACNIYLSLGWQFTGGSHSLSTLPLLAAICVCRALERAGLRGQAIKWPNDIMVDNAKLAGILVEMQAAAGGPATAVIGVGLNVSMAATGSTGREAEIRIDRRWTDLASQLPADGVSSRNLIAAWLLEELLSGLQDYRHRGFGPFRPDWESLDLLAGRQIQVQHQGQSILGEAGGIDRHGGLQLAVSATDGTVESLVFHAGEVSVMYD